MEQEKKVNEAQEEEMVELSDDDLDMVSGGAGMRRTKKQETVEISEDTMSKI